MSINIAGKQQTLVWIPISANSTTKRCFDVGLTMEKIREHISKGKYWKPRYGESNMRVLEGYMSGEYTVNRHPNFICPFTGAVLGCDEFFRGYGVKAGKEDVRNPYHRQTTISFSPMRKLEEVEKEIEDDKEMETICQKVAGSGMLEVIDVGDSIDDSIFPPDFWDKFTCIPSQEYEEAKKRPMSPLTLPACPMWSGYKGSRKQSRLEVCECVGNQECSICCVAHEDEGCMMCSG